MNNLACLSILLLLGPRFVWAVVELDLCNLCHHLCGGMFVIRSRLPQ